MSFLATLITEGQQVNSVLRLKHCIKQMPQPQETSPICLKFTTDKKLQQIQPTVRSTPKQEQKEKKANVRKIKQLELKGIKISTKMVEDAIKSSMKSKALEPDNIAPIHLHFIGKQAIKYQ